MLGDQHAYSSCRSFILRRHTRRISGFLFPFGKKAYISPSISSSLSFLFFTAILSHVDALLLYRWQYAIAREATLHSLARNNNKDMKTYLCTTVKVFSRGKSVYQEVKPFSHEQSICSTQTKIHKLTCHRRGPGSIPAKILRFFSKCLQHIQQ